MRIDKNTTLADFFFKINVFKIDEEQIKPLFEKLDGLDIAMLGGKKVPENLNELTFGQLAKLLSVTKTEDVLFDFPDILLELDKETVLKLPAFSVIKFMLFIRNELERIGNMFDKIKYVPTPEEIRAGINLINNGLFGVMDWYAKRMGIKDQAEVESIPWLRIYKCLEIDNNQSRFERKLHEVYTKK